MRETPNPSQRGSTFVTLDLAETASVIWAVDRECERMRQAMKHMAPSTHDEVQPLFDSLEAIHARLKKRYDSARFHIFSQRPRQEESADAR